MNSTNIFLALFISFLMTSCGFSHPPFDADTPDTENNVFHYENLIKVKISDDVKNLYSYGNEMGIDASYYISFRCNEQTSEKIIKENQMTVDSKKGMPLFSSLKFKWWNKDEIDTLNRFVYSNTNNTYFKYFWYNENTHQGYFLDFDL